MAEVIAPVPAVALRFHLSSQFHVSRENPDLSAHVHTFVKSPVVIMFHQAWNPESMALFTLNLPYWLLIMVITILMLIFNDNNNNNDENYNQF